MHVIYIAGPFRGQTAWQVHRNVCEAEEFAFMVAEAGAMPLCPHTNTAHFDGTMNDRFWLVGTLELLRRCDAIFVTSRWVWSSGARAEMKEAIDRGMPAFQDVPALRLWLAGESDGRESYELFATQMQSAAREIRGVAV